MKYCMDVDFYSSVCKNFTIKKIPFKLGKFRVHDDSKTQNILNRKAHKKEYKEVLSKNFNYRWLDSNVFEFFYIRSQVASYIKQNWMKG